MDTKHSFSWFYITDIMVSRAVEERLTHKERQQFTAALSRLKQRGAALLVVGNVPNQSYAQVCSHMLGDDNAATRRRLFISTDTDVPSVADRFAVHHTELLPEITKQLTWNSGSRSAASPPQSASSQVPSVSVDGDQLGKFGVAISEAITEFDEAADGLDPAELRVCFDSLQTLLSDHNRESVFRFLHVLIGRLQTVNAMSHFHLPIDWESEAVQLFSELFDATVELQIANNQVQQRWHLRDVDITSDWLSL